MNEYRISFEAVSTATIEQLSIPFYEHFDGVLVERGGQVVLTVYVRGRTGLEAAHSAIDQLEEALDVSVCHVDYDLVDGPEIASRLDVRRQTVHNWATGTRGSGFPRPFGSPGGKRVWAWGQVVDWAQAHQGSTETPAPTRDELAVVDAYLARRRMGVTSYPTWAIKGGTPKAQAAAQGTDDYQSDSRIQVMA